MYRQIHTEEQFQTDGGLFGNQLRLLTKEKMTRDEPGDMKERGVWTFEDTLSYCPYSQFSCSYGVANVYTADHLDRVHQLAEKYGKTFVFSVVDGRPLAKALMNRLDKFEILREQESWMQRGKMVFLVGSKT
jgi:hypothetical protein